LSGAPAFRAAESSRPAITFTTLGCLGARRTTVGAPAASSAGEREHVAFGSWSQPGNGQPYVGTRLGRAAEQRRKPEPRTGPGSEPEPELEPKPLGRATSSWFEPRPPVGTHRRTTWGDVLGVSPNPHVRARGLFAVALDRRPRNRQPSTLAPWRSTNPSPPERRTRCRQATAPQRPRPTSRSR